MAVEQILKTELPNVKVELGSLGVGSFPQLSLTDNNAEADRIVLVLINLMLSVDNQKPGPPGPERTLHIYTHWWQANVRVFFAADGVAVGILELELGNVLGQKLEFQAELVGVGGQIRISPRPGLEAQMPSRPLHPNLEGHTAFHIPKGADFTDFIDQEVIVGKSGFSLSKLGGPDLNYISFPGLGTEGVHIAFDTHAWKSGKLSWPKVAFDVLHGTLKMIGKKPREEVTWRDRADSIDAQARGFWETARVLGFPTGKAWLDDLDPIVRNDFRSWVINGARKIAAHLEMFGQNP
jgi:hypothetical protein